VAEESQSIQNETGSKLSNADGHIVFGIKIDDHRFVARLKASQLFQIAPDPRDAENPRRVDASRQLQSIAEVRAEVQRRFAGAKSKNVPSYAEYIIAISKYEQDGLTPPIVLFSKDTLTTDINKDGIGVIQIPFEQQLVAIDGETQLAARYEAKNMEPDTLKDFVPVYICHGHTIDWARQCFHDLNTYAIRPNAALSTAMDARDPLTQVTRDLENAIPFFKGRVNKVRRQLGKNDPEIVTITALRGACITFAESISGVKYGTRPVPVESGNVARIRECAVEWFSEVTATIGTAMEDPQSLAASSSVLAAIGAIGHELLSLDKELRIARIQSLVDRLKSVNWKRGKHWEGIAGKFTPKGVFSVGGSKETAYAVYSALNDPNSIGYKRIREIDTESTTAAPTEVRAELS
jgi:DGQHR domain-containing protein